MASALMLPDGFAPTNLHLLPSSKVRYIDGDVFDICERLAEISPLLYIVQLTTGDQASYVIMERCDDGVQRQVIKVDELDERCLTRVRYLLHVPFEHRIAALEAENDKYEADHHDNLIEEMYDKVGGDMHRQLWHDGFIEHRGVSYPKLGVAAPRRAR